jgi:hypothetical protein
MSDQFWLQTCIRLLLSVGNFISTFPSKLSTSRQCPRFLGWCILGVLGDVTTAAGQIKPDDARLVDQATIPMCFRMVNLKSNWKIEPNAQSNADLSKARTGRPSRGYLWPRLYSTFAVFEPPLRPGRHGCEYKDEQWV